MTQPRFHLVEGDATGSSAPSHERRYWCRGCDGDILASSLDLVSRHTTSEGTLEYVRCQAGHLGIRRRPRPGFDDAVRRSTREDAG